jgi:16S rRNA (adenine1518-N6/adenine1519-N6)-dimethyltransferase
MKLSRLSDVRDLTTSLGFNPSRVLGQNFLIDGNILDIIIEALALQPDDRVLEVGPGLGVLTERLLAEAGHLTAIEKDRRLCAHLREHFDGVEGLALVEGDALACGMDQILAAGITAFASNLPYSVGSRILVDICTGAALPDRMVVMVQLEVAQRITARGGDRHNGVLAVACQLGYDVELIKVVSPNCFWPRPDVRSGIVRFNRRDRGCLTAAQRRHCLALVKRTFGQRRKQAARLLAAGSTATVEECQALLIELGFDPRSRAEDLGVATWEALSLRLAAPSEA